MQSCGVSCDIAALIDRRATDGVIPLLLSHRLDRVVPTAIAVWFSRPRLRGPTGQFPYTRPYVVQRIAPGNGRVANQCPTIRGGGVVERVSPELWRKFRRNLTTVEAIPIEIC